MVPTNGANGKTQCTISNTQQNQNPNQHSNLPNIPNNSYNTSNNNNSNNTNHRGSSDRNRPGGAAHLARIHGTEEDKVNCPFYFKIGACRHADRCSRLHHRPAFSPTILIKHIYRHPIREAELRASTATDKDERKALETVDNKQALEDFLQFFENLYEELGKFGRLEALNVCDNLGDHMIGHVYAKFSDEEEAADALQILNGRYYDGRKMEVEYSPVTDFREARCRDFDEDTCSRGGFCNFMHIKPVPICLIRNLEMDCAEERRREAMVQAEREYKERNRRRRKKMESGNSSRRGSSRRDNSSSSDDSGRSRSRSRSRSRERSKRGSNHRVSTNNNRERSPSSSRSRSPRRNRSRSPTDNHPNPRRTTRNDRDKETRENKKGGE